MFSLIAEVALEVIKTIIIVGLFTSPIWAFVFMAAMQINS